MFNYKTQLVAELNTILPTWYELFADSSTATPCITYTEVENSSAAEGDTLRYSRIAFQLKIWGDDLAALEPYTEQVDTKMKQLGFTRVSFNELWYGNQVALIFRYEATACEN